MAALTGVSTFVAAGDSGSTTCGTNLGRTTLSYPAASPFVTAVGGTRLALGAGNTGVSETVWNDSVYGVGPTAQLANPEHAVLRVGLRSEDAFAITRTHSSIPLSTVRTSFMYAS